MPGPVTVRCPTCRVAFSVPTEQIGQDGHHVIVRMDRSDLYGHLRTCTGPKVPGKAVEKRRAAPVTTVPQAELAGRIHRMLDMRAYVVEAGSRACTMCGMSGASCLALAGQNTREPCCRSCKDGNTHPVPGEAEGSCAQWAEARGAES